MRLTLVPNPDPYVRDVELPSKPGHIDVETIALQGGVFEHRIVEIQDEKAGPDFWWDLNNTLVYRGDTIESVGNEDARFFTEKELRSHLESEGSEPVVLVMRTDFVNHAERENGTEYDDSAV